MEFFNFQLKGGEKMKRQSNCNLSKKQYDYYSKQKNPNNKAYKANLDNRANQLNPNNIRYYLSRIKNI